MANRLIAYKQTLDANIVTNGNFQDFDGTFYNDWTRSVGGANTLPSATNIANSNGGFSSVVFFEGDSTNYSRILQNIPCIEGKVYQINYRIGRVDNGGNECRLLGFGNSPVVNIPNTVGVHSLQVLCSTSNSFVAFQVQGGTANGNILLDWIEVVEISPYEIDLFDNEEVVLTYEIDDIRTIDSKNSGYSKSFGIPASKKNSKFFKHMYHLSDAGDFNPYAKCRAVMFAEGIEVFKGFMKLDNIVKKDNHSIFNVTLFQELADLKTELGTKTLANLGFQQLTHDYTKTNIINSWTGGLVLEDGSTTDAIKYPMCNWIGNMDGTASNIHLNNFQDAFRPWIKAKYLWDRIFDESTFQYESTFLNSSAFTDLYVDWNFGESFSTFGGSYSDHAEFRVDTEYETVYANAPQIGTSYALPDYDELTNVGAAQIGNQSNDFFNLTTNTFTATEDNQTVYVYVDAVAYGTPNTLGCAIEHNSTVPGCLPNQYLTEPTGNIVSTTVTDAGGSQHTFANTDMCRLTASVGTFTLNQGETIEIKFAKSLNQGFALGFAMAMFQVQAGVTFNPASVLNRTKIKQFDFVKAITQMFNLVMIPNDTNDKFLTIEPAQQYFETGTTQDWTKKIDVREIQIVPNEVAREYRFRFKNDADDFNLNKYFENNNGKVYGEHVKRHDFEVISKEVLEHENVLFSPTYMRKTQGILMPQIYGKEDGQYEQIKNNIRIMYDVGVQNVNAYTSETQNNDSFNNQTSVLCFANTQNYSPAIDDLQVDYGQSQSYFPGGNVPFRTLFFEYYSDIIKQITQRQSRILKVKANLTANDVLNYQFKDTIFFENQLYRINRLEYNTTPGELSVVELIRLSSDTQFADGKTHGDKECIHVPYAISITGQVIFQNPATNQIVSPTQECCEQFGYFWYPAILECNHKEDAIGHGHGHGNGHEHHNDTWSGGHHFMLGNVSTNGFGSGTKNTLIIGNRNSAQQNTKNIAIVGETNQFGSDIKNTLVVGQKHRIDNLVTGTSFGSTGIGIDDSIVSGKGAFVKASNVRTFASNESDDYILQKTECIYKGRVTTQSQTEIFLNGVTDSRYNLPNTNAFVTIQVDIYGIISDSASRDFGHYTRKRYIVTGAGVGATKTRIDDVDEVSHYTNHAASWSIDIDETNQNLRIRVTGSADATEWVAHCTIMEQDFTT